MKKVLLLCAATALHLAALTEPARGQGGEPYPNRPIKLVVAFPAGGGADLTARTLGRKMSESMRQTVVVENRPGANGSIGSEQVARAAPDGYSLLLVDRGALAINPSLYTRLAYDPLQDFAFVGIATTAPYVLVANPSVPVESVADLIGLAKRRPGAVTYGSFGIGSMPQLDFEAFNFRYGTAFQHVPYKGAGPAVKAVVGGEVALAIASAPSILGFVHNGRLHALAVGADERLSLLPQVPTVVEAGIASDVFLPTYFALAAPARTPPEVVSRLNGEMRHALASPAVAETLRANGLHPAGSSSEEMRRTVRADLDRFREIAHRIGLAPE